MDAIILLLLLFIMRASSELVTGDIGISYNNGEYKRKLTHQAFRIDESTLNKLKHHAKRKNVTLNALVNTVLTSYASSDIYFEELGSIPVAKGIMRALFMSIPKENLLELGRRTGPSVREHIAYLFREVNSNNLLSYLDLSFGRFHSCQHTMESSRHFYSIIHDINTNFSIFYQGFLEGLIVPIIKEPMRFAELTEGTISFSFNVKDSRTQSSLSQYNNYLDEDYRNNGLAD